MSDQSGFDGPRPRPVPTVLDVLRPALDLDALDAVAFAPETVTADDGRPIPGSVAWIDKLRADGKRTLLVFATGGAPGARFDLVVAGARTAESLLAALGRAGVPPERTALVDVDAEGIAAARDAGVHKVIAVARGAATPEELRKSGADMIVADLQELLGFFAPTHGKARKP